MGIIYAKVFSTLVDQGLGPRLNVRRLEVTGLAERDIANGGIGVDPVP